MNPTRHPDLVDKEQRIQSDVADFLATGGKIYKAANGESKEENLNWGTWRGEAQEKSDD